MVEILGEQQDEPLPVPEPDSSQLRTAFQWVEDHRHTPHQLTVDRITNQCLPIPLNQKDKQLLDGREPTFYASMLVTASYLGVPSLSRALEQTVAAFISSKPREYLKDLEEVRKFFGDPKDLSREERDAIEKEIH